MTEPTAPTIPADAPQDVKDFFACTGDRLVWRPGSVSWLGLPTQPDVSFAPGAAPGTINITVSVMGGMVSFSLPAHVNASGELVVDSSDVPDLSSLGMGGRQDVDNAIRNINAWFRKNGKQLKQPELRDGTVTLEKTPILVSAAPPATVPVAPTVPPTPTPAPPAAPPAGSDASAPGTGGGGWCSLLGLLLALLFVGAIGIGGLIVFNLLPSPGGLPAATPTQAAVATPTARPTATAPATATAGATATPTAVPVAPTPTAVPASPTQVPIGQRTDFFDALVELGALDAGRVEDYMDDYQTDPSGDHSHASGQAPGFTPPFIDIRGHVGFRWTVADDTATLLEGAFPCTTPPGAAFRVQCLGTMPITPGDWVFVNVMSHGPLPEAFGDRALANLAVVFDDDGDPGTGYQADPAFPGDSFVGSTRWYEQFYFGTTSRCLATDATLLNDQGFPERNNFLSQGRFVSWRSNSQGVAEYVLMVPAQEVGSYYRAVMVATEDGTTYAAEVTSHDYTEAAEPFSFFPLELY